MLSIVTLVALIIIPSLTLSDNAMAGESEISSLSNASRGDPIVRDGTYLTTTVDLHLPDIPALTNTPDYTFVPVILKQPTPTATSTNTPTPTPTKTPTPTPTNTPTPTTIPCGIVPKAGDWQDGNELSFSIPSSKDKVINFRHEYETSFCGSGTLTVSQIPIDGCTISYSVENGNVAVWGEGTFDSKTTASGLTYVFTGNALCFVYWDASWTSSE